MQQRELTPAVLRERAADHIRGAKYGTVAALGSIAASFIPENPVAEANRYGAAVVLTLAASLVGRALEARRDAAALETQNIS